MSSATSWVPRLSPDRPVAYFRNEFGLRASLSCCAVTQRYTLSAEPVSASSRS
ncbi:hypothetical protein VB780_26200 [Leptolyngbya sp. CCNP1308]|uniref:hypothetical protein n=1 Tax=Leptolyngbya sp. CCNP1308 TaxID=3110255 RepID=UPI002B1FC86B|nr:hypothetical protein [Leptolyngbya sp. CCNP1308]MEA5452094.1 hypothetical protein [Leptolyngbya sp. CCNP1308]